MNKSSAALMQKFQKQNSQKEPLDSVARSSEPPAKYQRSQTPKHTISDEFAWDFEDLDNVFTDDFLNSLSEPYMFPDPRDVYGGNNADIMQPGLLPLQPTIEEIMQSLGEMPDSPPFPNERDTMRTPNQDPPRPSTSSHQQAPQMRRSASSSASLHQINHQVVPQSQQSQAQAQAQAQHQIQQPVARPPGQDFMTSSIMMDYRMMPTRQSSAITSQMLMLSHSASTSTSQPQYTTSTHYNVQNAFLPVRNSSIHHHNQNQSNQWQKPQQQQQQQQQPQNFLVASLPHQSHVERILNNQPIPRSNIVPSDSYMPQFLQSPQTVPPQPVVHDPMMAPSRSWWMDSPLTASVQSPLSVATPLSLTNQNGPQTPLGQLIGRSAPADATNFLLNNGLMEQMNRKTGPTLSQRLEQPPIVSAQGSLFGVDPKPKVFTSLTSQHTPIQSPLDFSSLSRLRTTSLNDTWKMSPIPGAIEPNSTNYQALAAAVSARPSVLEVDASSAFGSPSTPSTSLPAPSPAQPPAQAQPQPAAQPKIIPPPQKRKEPEPAPQMHRQQSCDATLLNGAKSQQNNAVKTEEKMAGRQFSTDVREVTKEEPLPMSAPSSVKSMRRQAPDSTLHPEERKRILHLHAEQNRRSALKDGFDQLMDILPDLYSGGVKPTNAVVLAKAADHIRRLQGEKWEKTSKIDDAKAKIEKLNQRIASLQSNLPQSSAPSNSSQLDSKTSLETFFDRYVKENSKKDWRFWVVSNSYLEVVC
uniref:BHLH domain-containing protein n=1 Tax=Caenorhabditis japonica TaxID=281687 RepID=A0A8R1DF78_CAEJA